MPDLEDYLPVVGQHGFSTKKPVRFDNDVHIKGSLKGVSTSTRTVGYEDASFVADAGSINPQLQKAHDTNTTGTKLYIKEGTYTGDKFFNISASDITIELSQRTTIRMAQSLDTGAFKDEYRAFFMLRKSGAGGTQRNVTIRGGVLDCNFQPDTCAVSIWGSGNNPNVYATENITFEDVTFKNMGNSISCPALVQVHSATDLNLGRVRNINFVRCTFDTTDDRAVVLRGSYGKDITFYRCRFTGVAKKSIDLVGGGEAGFINRTWENITIDSCRFEGNMLTDMETTLYDFGMNSRIGVKGLYIYNNIFDGTGQFKKNDNPHLQIYASEDVKIIGNTFKEGRQAFSFGYSNNGTPWFIDPNTVVTIANNHFIRMKAMITDYDSTTRMSWIDNHFAECGLGIFNSYSMHAFDKFEGNVCYNMNSIIESDEQLALYTDKTVATLPDTAKCVISLAGQNQMFIKNNQFIDDRKLADPVKAVTTSGITTINGGTQAERTYYYRFAYANDSGVTLPCATTSITVPANKLLRLRPVDMPANARHSTASGVPSTPTIGISGVRKVLIYVGTVSGAETLQATIEFGDYYKMSAGWTEPTTGLIAGAALPTQNTTHRISKWGIAEFTDAGGYVGPNTITGNDFFGYSKAEAIYTPNPLNTRMIRKRNTYVLSTTPDDIDADA